MQGLDFTTTVLGFLISKGIENRSMEETHLCPCNSDSKNDVD